MSTQKSTGKINKHWTKLKKKIHKSTLFQQLYQRNKEKKTPLSDIMFLLD